MLDPEPPGNSVGRDIASPLVYENILNGLMAMYGPDRFIDKLRVRRLATLHLGRSELLDEGNASAAGCRRPPSSTRPSRSKSNGFMM
jgi:hypothetical protein